MYTMGKSESGYSIISNGVHQGGILSPKLFSLFMNTLRDTLIACNSGCYINDKCIYHVMYADDSCYAIFT